MARLTLPLVAILALTGCGVSNPTDTGPKDSNPVDTNIGDEDGDGYTTSDGDCDETDPAINPGAVEECDGVDNNCDDQIDEGLTGTYYQDSDGDGFGDDGVSVVSCDPGAGWTSVPGDCDDLDGAVNPDAQEICDGIDNNCDGGTDEGLTGTWYQDIDADGFGDPSTETTGCQPGVGWVENGDDCDDGNQLVNPEAEEVCDEIDNDCDASIDEGVTSVFYVDADGDHFGDNTPVAACSLSAGLSDNNNDCDDRDAAVNPSAIEICNEIDDDCDSAIDEDVTSVFYNDVDHDSYGDPASRTVACSSPGATWVTNDGDCNDSEPLAWTGATEVCDEVDNNCDGSVDEGVTGTYYRDGDGDTYGDPSVMVNACSSPGSAWVTNDGDCNDSEALAWTGATEVCDTVDNDCDGRVDEAVTATWYHDGDGDTYGDPSASVESCTSPGSDYVTNDNDCNDAQSAAWTGASELCDSIDNDCDGSVDEDAIDGSEFPADADGDGFGDSVSTVFGCTGVDNTLDCDDSLATEPKVVDGSSTATSWDGTAAAPFLTIQEGIDSARACVVVYPGTYSENIDFGGADVLVQSVNGPEDTIIFGVEGAGSVVTFNSGETNAAELSGFTVAGGSGTVTEEETTGGCGSSEVCYVMTRRYMGGGIYVDGAAPTLSDLIVRASILPGYNLYVVDMTHQEYTYSYGGGIFVGNTTAVGTVQANNVNVILNQADRGGGIYVGETATLSYRAGMVGYNTADTAGGGVAVAGSTASATFKNAVIVSNVGGDEGGGAHVEDGLSAFENITSVGNAATMGGGFAAMGMGSQTLMNSIVAQNTTGDGIYVDSGAAFSGAYNNVYGNTSANYNGITDPTGGSGNISADPMFVSWTDDSVDNDDFHLAGGSPSINTGNPGAAYYDADSTRNDQGAYGGSGSSW